MAPRWPKIAPRRPRDGPKTAQDVPKTAQETPKMAKDRPKTAPRLPKIGPSHSGPSNIGSSHLGPYVGSPLRHPLGAFLDAPRRPQDRPRGFQDAPRRPKTPPRRLQDAPRRPRTPSRRPRTPPGVDFRPIWGSKFAKKSFPKRSRNRLGREGPKTLILHNPLRFWLDFCSQCSTQNAPKMD